MKKGQFQNIVIFTVVFFLFTAIIVTLVSIRYYNLQKNCKDFSEENPNEKCKYKYECYEECHKYNGTFQRVESVYSNEDCWCTINNLPMQVY